MKREIGGLDLVRFVAALMVSVFHLGFWVWAFPLGMSGRAAGHIQPIDALAGAGSFGWVGVEIFFVISGFVIAFSASASTPSGFARRRFLRLVPAVWVLAPLTAAVALAVNSLGFLAAARRLISSVLFVPFGPWIDSVYWTLGIEIVFYACIWLLLRLGRADQLERFAYVLGAASTVFWLCLMVWPSPPLASSRILDLLLLHHGALFAVGVLLWAVWAFGLTTLRVTALVVYSGAACLQIATRAGLEAAKTGADPLPWVPVLVWLFTVGLIILALRFRFGGAWTRIVGLMSYPLYLIHNVAGAALLGVMIRAGVEPLLAVAVAVTAAILVSWVVAVYLEPMARTVIDKVVLRPFWRR